MRLSRELQWLITQVTSRMNYQVAYLVIAPPMPDATQTCSSSHVFERFFMALTHSTLVRETRLITITD